MGNAPYEICECGSKKWRGTMIGPFPRPDEMPVGANACTTQEYFGVNMLSFNEILVNQQVFQAIRKEGLAGVDFYPVATEEQQAEQVTCSRPYLDFPVGEQVKSSMRIDWRNEKIGR